MELWPAIDISKGRCVRLFQGDFGRETVYGDPVEVAARYLAEGASRLHVVDLDGALTGVAGNRDTVVAIARKTGLIVQAGGGVGDEQAASALLDSGIARVVVGTAAVMGAGEVLAGLAARWPGRVVAGLDYRSSRSESGSQRREVAVRGWAEASGVTLEEALERLEGLELAGVVVTDIGRDGTGSGPAISTYAELLGQSSLPLVASGGVASAGDIARLARLESGGRKVAGVIVGKALLSGAITMDEARRAAQLGSTGSA